MQKFPLNETYVGLYLRTITWLNETKYIEWKASNNWILNEYCIDNW